PGSIEQKIGYFYESGMNEAAVDAAGIQPLQPVLRAISQIMTQPQLVDYLDASFAKGQGGLFAFGSGADFKNAKMQIGYAFQGGLGLPTPDYYTQPEHAKLREQYL
ncbi:Peptidase M13 domain protein, partial [mine drainage metagenome]